MNLKTINDYVWFYYDKGFSVIPLGAKGNLKAPSIEEWKQYQEKRADKQIIQAWLDSGLFVGIGIIAGKVSDNLAILDFDDDSIPNEIGLKLDKIVENGNWVVKTGKGYHIYCKGNEPVKTRKAAIVSMDLKAEGGYVAAPPSPHESGNSYEFINTDFSDIPIQKADELFDDIVKKIKDKRKIKPPIAKEIAESGNEPPCIGHMKNGAERGRRNETAYVLASYYRHSKKMGIDDITKLLISWNNDNERPLPEQELLTTIKSAYKSSTPKGCTSIMDLGYCPYSDDSRSNCPFFKTEDENLMEPYGVFDGKKVNYYGLAQFILAEHEYKFLIVKDESTDKKSVYAYYDGYYHNDGKDIIKYLVTKYLRDRSSIKAKDEVVSVITDLSACAERGDVEPHRKFINLENGVYDFMANELLPHSHDYRFLQKIPIQYIPKAKCPKFMKFLGEVVSEDEIPIVQEMFGYSLYRGYPVNAAFLLFGTGRNGKSVLLKVLRNLVGRKNICSRTIHELTDDPFAKADLYGKLANICGEMDATGLKETGTLKELTGEDWATAQRKYHGSFQFQNYAKLIFATNQVPKTNDSTFGLYDRFRIIHFTKMFYSSNPKTDVHIYDKISTEEEMQGILLWALDGLKRLLKNNAISGSEALENIGDAYEDAVNYEWDWMRDHIKGNGNFETFISIGEIYKEFDSWCERLGKPKSARNSFCKKLRGFAKVHGGRDVKRRINGVELRGYAGISFDPGVSEDIENMHDEPEGIMKDISEMCPTELKYLNERFGKDKISYLIKHGILIKLPNGKMDVDI